MMSKNALALHNRFTNSLLSFRAFVEDNIDTIETEDLYNWREDCKRGYDIENLDWAINYKKQSLLKLWIE